MPPALRLRDRAFWVVSAATTIVCVSVFEVLTLFSGPNRRERYARLVRIWGRLVLAGRSLAIEGAERIPRGEPLLFISNHQGNLDIPLLHAVLPVTFRWVARHDLFGIPFLGRAMRRMDAIEIDRGDRRSSLAALRKAVQALEAGQNVVVFPEGTWGDAEGRMRPFRPGVLAIASRTSARVVPLTILNSHRVNPPRTRTVHRGPLRVVVHPAMPGPDGAAGVEAWLVRLREVIGSALPHGIEAAEIGGERTAERSDASAV